MNDLLPLLETIDAQDASVLGSVRERHGISQRGSLRLLAEEIRLDGSNSFTSLFRGYEGVAYEEIVCDVASKLGAPVRAEDSLVEAEWAVLRHVAEGYWEGLSEEERARILDGTDEIPEDFDADALFTTLSGGGALAALLMREVVTKLVARLMANVLLKAGLKEGAKHATRIAAYTVPFVGVVLALWTVNDIAGPAYRKTVPTVVQLALLRLQHAVE